MFNRYGERVREGIGEIGDLNTGNGTPGSRNGPTDDNDDIDYHPGNGKGLDKEKDTTTEGMETSTTDSTSDSDTTTTDTSTSETTESTESTETSTTTEETEDITTELVKENPYRYSHYYWDRKTQFYYLQARYYNPRVGRFLSMDPWRGEVTSPLSLNRYVYAYNNPVNYIDPTGLMAWYQVDDLLYGVAVSAGEAIVDAIKSPVYMYELSKAMITGQLSFKDLLNGIGQSAKEPIAHLINNHKLIWQDKPRDPSNKEVKEYGRQLGNTIQMAAGSAGAIKILAKAVPKLAKSLNNLPKKVTTKNYNTKTSTIDSRPYKDNLYPTRPPNSRFQCACFTLGTLVETVDGAKAIEDIGVGDLVLSKNEETGEVAYKEVEWLFQREVQETYNLTVGGQVITTTDEHPFWVVGEGWVEAKDLQAGDIFETSEEEHLTLEKIEVKKEKTTVYNFKVKDFHSYFVTNLQIWTHNRCAEFDDVGGTKGTGKTEKHHIATDKSKKFDFKNHPAFKGTGINVSKDIDNLVDLANHRGRHTNKYHQEVQDRLDAVYNRYGGTDKLEGAVRTELQKMKQELLDGKLDPYGK
jgi:RHS repeat-associated protein